MWVVGVILNNLVIASMVYCYGNEKLRFAKEVDIQTSKVKESAANKKNHEEMLY